MARAPAISAAAASMSPCARWLLERAALAAGALLLTTCIMLSFDGPQSRARPGPPAPPPAPVPTYRPECTAHERCAGLKGNCCPTDGGVLLECCSVIASSASLLPFYSMCYAPTPAKTREHFRTDDYMAPWSEPLWGASGRDDLATIRALNVTTLRVYGNDPRLSHRAFLDRARQLGLGVIVAISDYPYTQDPQASCATAPPYDCFWEVRAQYLAMLRHGFVVMQRDGSAGYHEAIRAIILINEPELKITYNGQIAKEAWSAGFCAKAAISALDGALAAEAELGLSGRLPPFTITHSFATCGICKASTAGNHAGQTPIGNLAAIPFMYDFVLAALSPGLYGYSEARHDLRAALQQRFALGFNTQDSAEVVCNMLLGPLHHTPLSGLPVWAGEYKAWYQSLPDQGVTVFEDDLSQMRSLVDGDGACPHGAAAKLSGVSIFEFQVSYYKGSADHQQDFGIYELGAKQLGNTTQAEETGWQEYPVWCLRQKRNEAGESWVGAVAKALGGKAPTDDACPMPPWRSDAEVEETTVEKW